MIVAGASAYPRIIDFEKFKEIADEVGALPDGGYGAHIAGLSGCRAAPKPSALCRFCDHNYP